MRQHETQTHQYLRQHLPEATTEIRHNKVLVGTRYRPDFVIQQKHSAPPPPGCICVVLEVDENGHSLYDKVMETQREEEIARCIINRGMRPVLIRFDPAPCRAGDKPPLRLASRLRTLLDVVLNELTGCDMCHDMVTRSKNKNPDYKKISLY